MEKLQRCNSQLIHLRENAGISMDLQGRVPINPKLSIEVEDMDQSNRVYLKHSTVYKDRDSSLRTESDLIEAAS